MVLVVNIHFKILTYNNFCNIDKNYALSSNFLILLLLGAHILSEANLKIFKKVLEIDCKQNYINSFYINKIYYFHIKKANEYNIKY
jgi:hypothetical protein